MHGHLDPSPTDLHREGLVTHESLAREVGREDAQSVPAALELTAVRIEHAQAYQTVVLVGEQHDHAVRTNPAMSVAHRLDRLGGRTPVRALSEHQVVVAQAVRFVE